ncbi:MAG: alkaline phosphatase family protein [Acidobacteria bacterium]|nr:alkaline phosphatase family protein [Acidobacteriota bacterium]
MKPEYVTKSDEYHTHVPNLRKMMSDGTYAEGVIGVLPTVTFPSHTTMVTGVWPAEHGIPNNHSFDPLGQHPDDWPSYFNRIKVPTLWQAAHEAGLTTASVFWPVTVNPRYIDHFIAAYPASETVPIAKDAVVEYPAGLRKQIDKTLPENTTLDDRKFYWALWVLKQYKPDFMTAHLTNLDHAQHISYPFSDASLKAIKQIDEWVGQLIAAERKNYPDAIIVIVSDHGFAASDYRVNLPILFVQNGLITPARLSRDPGDPPVLSWKASVWVAGPTAAIVLKDPRDKDVRKKVRKLLEKAAKNPTYGIDRILTHEEVIKEGGFPDPAVAYVVSFKTGYRVGEAINGDIVEHIPHGSHGYLPTVPEMRSSFFCSGPSVAKGRELGIIDMRQIAPTVAQMLGVHLEKAKLPPVHYEP